MKTRDDFSQRTKETLAKRVGYRCSNPSCRVNTIGPKTEEDQSLNLGVASHITAASEGGPRYDSTLTSGQRKSLENGIWTCIRCSVLVDKDPSPYSTETLCQWKSHAEKEAKNSLLSPQFSGSIQIRATFDRFEMYKDNRKPGDSLVFIDGFSRGDIQYWFEYCLCNVGSHPVTLHRFRLEFRKDDELIYSDEYAIQQEFELRPHKWEKKEAGYGLHREKCDQVYRLADSLWLTVQTVGENQKFEWKITDLKTPYESLPWGG